MSMEDSQGSNGIQDIVKQGAAVMRIENETQIQIAIQRPRDEQAVFEKLLRILDIVPEFAEDAYYSIPYEDSNSGKKVPVEGLTIKSAMEILRNWGNAASAARIVDELDDRIIVEGVVIDYENNIRVMRQQSVSKFRRDRNSKSYLRLAPDRLNMAIQAGMSKAARNAVFQIIPEWIKDAFFKKAKQIVANPPKSRSVATTTVKEKIEAAKGMFVKKYNVTIEQINDFVANLEVATDEDVLANLRGIWNSIKDGEATVESIFGKPEPAGVSMPQEKQG